MLDINSCVSWVLYLNGLLAEADLPFGTTETPWGQDSLSLSD